jgi:hypothetical protein
MKSLQEAFEAIDMSNTSLDMNQKTWFLDRILEANVCHFEKRIEEHHNPETKTLPKEI